MAKCIILGDNYSDYKSALKTLKLKTLAERRENICVKFAKKSYLNPEFKHWFDKNEAKNEIQTRQEKLS